MVRENLPRWRCASAGRETSVMVERCLCACRERIMTNASFGLFCNARALHMQCSHFTSKAHAHMRSCRVRKQWIRQHTKTTKSLKTMHLLEPYTDAGDVHCASRSPISLFSLFAASLFRFSQLFPLLQFELAICALNDFGRSILTEH